MGISFGFRDCCESENDLNTITEKSIKHPMSSRKLIPSNLTNPPDQNPLRKQTKHTKMNTSFQTLNRN